MNKMLQWATGAGKTKEALRLAEMLVTGYEYKILILVAERQHIQNWRDEMKKWNFRLEAEVLCYASLRKVTKTQCDVLILDECHHAASTLRLNLLRTIKAQNVIALSATPGDSAPMLERIFGAFEVFKKGLNELIDSGKLPKPEIFVYDLELDDVSRSGKHSECTQYNALTNRIKKEQRKFIMTRFEGDKYIMLQSGLERKRLLGSFKIPYVSYLLSKIEDKRYICFCPTIEIARELYSMHSVGSCCIDSKIPQKINEDNLRSFNEGNHDHLFVVGMLTEGTNLVDVEAGVLIQLDKGERTMIQKLGRTLRSPHPKMYFFRFRNTVDDELVKNIAWNIDSKHITTFSFKREILDKK